MQLDMMLLTMDDLSTAGAYARAIEEMGFAALWTAETQHNPFLPLAVAATTTHRYSWARPLRWRFRAAQRSWRTSPGTCKRVPTDGLCWGSAPRSRVTMSDALG